MRLRRYGAAILMLAIFAIVMVGPRPPSASARKDHVLELVKHAGNLAHRCNTHSKAWTVDEVKCAIIVYTAPRGMPTTRVMAIVRCESNFDPLEVNASSGAAGLTQFIPSTWRSLSERGSGYVRRLGRYAEARSRFDPVNSLRAMRVVWLSDGRSFHEWSCNSLV